MKYLIWLLLTTIIAVPVAAALDCPTVVATALQTTDELCEATGRNQACYGNVQVDAEPQPGVDSFKFDEAGDRVNVTEIQSLRLSPMAVASGEWGVAMMRLQASIPSSTPQDITLLMFGDVQVENAVQTPAVMLDVTVAVDEYINVRRLPSTRAGVMGVLAPGQTVRALERLENGSWVRIEVPDSGVIGWVDASLLSTQGDLSTLQVTQRWTPRYRPMQAFYFESGEDNPGCPEAPTSGMLIQTPQGVGEVTLLINEVSVRIGSTAYFQAQAGQEMRVSTVEGAVEVEAMGVTYTAAAGSEVSVQLDEHNRPAAPPSRPRPYNQTEWQSLPVEVLDEQVEVVPEPLTEEEIAEVVATDEVQNLTPTELPTEVPPTTDTSAAVVTGSLALESVCAGTWAVRNTTAADVGFQWTAVGNGASGGGVAPAGGEASFDASAEMVSISFDLGSGPESAGASSNGQPCAGTSPVATATEEAIQPTDEVVPPTPEPPPAQEPTAVPPTAEPPTEEPPADPPTPDPPPPTSEPPTPEATPSG
jgi:hypothetical protein